MALAPGSVTYMDYGQRRPRVTHTRLALALVEQDDWVILTPDYDMYVETLSAGNPDLQNFWVGPADGTLPAGVPAGSVYGFQPLTAGEIARYMGEGRAEADLEGVVVALLQLWLERLQRQLLLQWHQPQVSAQMPQLWFGFWLKDSWS